ncbi:MAG: hypothetical protein HYR96_15940 [Deltaproteobacteria bacterium]|nr:hypothetical protein [Deltaproteobacteria bacterium]MBI3296400.1 hypothetical protein [Deltaproteobacteria bacterium]
MDRRKRIAKVLSEALCGLLILGCANYASRIREPRSYIEFGRYDAAIEDLKALVERDDNDRLLYLMDLGIAYHAAGLYSEAIETFLKADKLAEIKDYTSLSQEIGSFILNDNLKFYQGENFEKVLINTYLAIDYTLAHQWDDALVECRRVNQKIDRMINEGGLPYERNAFAKYLAATLFEARGEYNDAFVDYRQLLKWNVDHRYLAESLLRMSDRLKSSQELAEYKQEFGKRNYRLDKGQGELVLILEQGKSPYKVPYEGFNLIPRFQKNYYSSLSGVLRVGERTAESHPFFDIEQVAIKELNDKIGRIMAKKIGGTVAKAVIADQIYQRDKALGILAWIAMRATDQADLRSWSTLPARLQLARLVVPAGRHDVSLDRVSLSGHRSVAFQWHNVVVQSGELVFLNYRMTD